MLGIVRTPVVFSKNGELTTARLPDEEQHERDPRIKQDPMTKRDPIGQGEDQTTALVNLTCKILDVSGILITSTTPTE